MNIRLLKTQARRADNIKINCDKLGCEMKCLKQTKRFYESGNEPSNIVKALNVSTS